jgi:hypothetical protein
MMKSTIIAAAIALVGSLSAAHAAYDEKQIKTYARLIGEAIDECVKKEDFPEAIAFPVCMKQILTGEAEAIYRFEHTRGPIESGGNWLSDWLARKLGDLPNATFADLCKAMDIFMSEKMSSAGLQHEPYHGDCATDLERETGEALGQATD